MSSAPGVDLMSLVAQYGFPIVIACYLLWERSVEFKKESERWATITQTVLEVVKANTASNTDLKATIQKLCEIVNRQEKGNG